MSKEISPATSSLYILIDGSSYIYRAFHALPPLSTSEGQPTWVIHGVLNMIKKLQKQYPLAKLVVFFDAPGKNFRHDLYKDYKANRPPMPDDLRQQVEPLYEIIQMMGLPIIQKQGIEADDLIGTLTHIIIKAGHQVLISTGDKDFTQLINSQITLINTMNDTIMDEKAVKETWGIKPILFIDFLALKGDKIDNIPGVPKIGDKTALALLQGLGGLKEIYRHLQKINDLNIRGAKSLIQRLTEYKEQAFLSYELATICTDLPLDYSLQDLEQCQPDITQLTTWFTKLEFKQWLKELHKEKANAKKETLHYITITTKKEFETWIQRLSKAEQFSFDTETTSLNYMQADLVGLSFAIKENEAAYVPCAHDYDNAPKQLSRDWVLKKIKPLLESDKILKIGQNLKYDKNILARYHITMNGIAFDTMLESYVLNSTATRHDMDSLANFYLNIDTIKYEDVAGKGVKQKTFNQIDIQQATDYAAEDADITLKLHQHLWKKLSSHPVHKVYQDIEQPLIAILSQMEQTGALIDCQLLNQQTKELTDQLNKLKEEAWEIAGQSFNLDSPKQLQEILFDQQKLPVIKKTAKGQPSTAEDVLTELAFNYPLPEKILLYRSLHKLCSTYTNKLPTMIDPKTQRLHTSYHQAKTTTGRLSSTDPNLQNIPIRTTEGKKIRQAFIAKKGYSLIAADYSQIELRIMAHLSGDKKLLDSFAHHLDVHKKTAADIFHVPLEKVTPNQRRSAKAINFGLIYGMSAFGLAKQLKISRVSAQEYIDLYFQRYTGVQEYMEKIKKQAKKNGYVETIYGRRLYLKNINSRDYLRRQAAERAAINAPLQGSAADIIKLAMLKIHHWIHHHSFDAAMIMQVHDELIFEVKNEHTKQLSQGIEEAMSQAFPLDVPLLVSIGIGNNWDEAH